VTASDLDRAWNAIVVEAQRRIADPAWTTWLSVLRPVGLEQGVLEVHAPDHARSWVSSRLVPLLQDCAQRALGPGWEIRLAPGAASSSGGRRGGRRGGAAGGRDEEGERRRVPERPLTPRFRFEEFVLGPANRFAHAAALTVAENPGIAYNPLFLCGPPGVGKTHLLHAIGHYARAHHPGIRVRYATAETFTSEFTDALRTRGIDGFKQRYRSIDLLLVDDVQFLMAKQATEEEFFHTFNALHEAGAQVVLTADRVPNDMEQLEQRLRDRFASGLVAEVEPPDIATRLMVLRKRITGQQLELTDPGALEEIARHVSTSVRAVEAALIRVVAFASLTDRPVTRALAQEVLGSLYPGRDRQPGTRRVDEPATTGEVLAATAAVFGLAVDDLTGRRNDKRTAWARKLAMYVAREETGASYPALGQAFGGRNHTTVLNAVRGVNERIDRDPAAQVDLARVHDRIAAVRRGEDDPAGDRQDDRLG
jgi:chromosomal replication initiator protein